MTAPWSAEGIERLRQSLAVTAELNDKTDAQIANLVFDFMTDLRCGPLEDLLHQVVYRLRRSPGGPCDADQAQFDELRAALTTSPLPPEQLDALLDKWCDEIAAIRAGGQTP